MERSPLFRALDLISYLQNLSSSIHKSPIYKNLPVMNRNSIFWHWVCHWIELMISMNLRIVPQLRRTAELIHALRLQMSRTEAQPGCIQCRLSQDQRQPNVVFYQEEWDCWTQIEKHIRSERFARILELMELSTVTPELSFCDIHETRGLEYVQQLRAPIAD